MNTVKSSPRPKRRDLRQHPHYFGAFLNTARHNAFMVMQHLSAKYDTKDKETLKEDSLDNASLVSYLNPGFKKPDVTHAVLRDLRWHFPFLNYPFFLNEQIRQNEREKPKKDRQIHNFPEPEPEKTRLVLQSFFLLLNQLRNNHCHFISRPDFSAMDPMPPLETIYQAAVFRLTDRGKRTKRFDVFEPQHVRHLTGDGNYAPKDLKANPSQEKTIAFITCLFLERKYAFPFLSRLEGFQNTSNQEPTLEMKATMECYTMFCCRLPQPKLESSDILLDMLNELGRCPTALYTVLSDEDQKKFQVKIEDGIEEEEELESIEKTEPSQVVSDEFSSENEQEAQEVLLIRHGDRFPYFALRYFDDTKAFPTLRFDVQLGRWRNRPAYDKVIYGENRERLITQPIRAYARLKPLRDLYENVDQTDKDRKLVHPDYASHFHQSWLTADAEGKKILRDEIEQFSPHYNFGENVIGLKFVNPQKHVFPKLPDPRNEKPDAVISTHELRNLFLYHYLHKTQVSSDTSETYISVGAEPFINDFITRMRRFFTDVKTGVLQPVTAPPDYLKNQPLPFVKGNEKETEKKRTEYRTQEAEIRNRRQQLDALLKERYGLSVTWIPDVLEEYLLAYKARSFKKRAEEKFKTQLKLVKERIKAADKGRSPRVGEQATWLAEDILFLTPPQMHEVDGKSHEQKLNNDQFRVLQRSLAYFSTNKQEVLAFLRTETPILSNNPQERHPFLFRVDIGKCKGIFDFYSDYLKAKKTWLEKILDKNELRKLNDKEMEQKYRHFLPPSVRDKSAAARDYNSLAVFLPRGLFNEAIAEALSRHPQFDIRQEDNAVHCLSKLLGGDLQEYYEFPHVYKNRLPDQNGKDELVSEKAYAETLKALFQKLKEQKARSGKLGNKKKTEIKNAYQDVTHAKRRLLDREQHIRFVQANDRALWLMAKGRQNLAAEHTEIKIDDLKLRNIESVLKEDIETKLRVPGSTAVITDRLPLRRYGDLRRIAKDRRLQNLSLYYEAAGVKEIPHEQVKKEFEEYDRRREGFFEVVFEFEKQVYKEFTVEFTPDLMEEEGFYKHQVYVDIAVRHSRNTPFNLFFQQQVKELRNKFHHNEFPWYDWLQTEVAKTKGDLYADRIFDLAECYYNDMSQLIRH